MEDGSERDRGTTELMPYWDRLANERAGDDPLKVVGYPGAPGWFNRFFARSQRRAVAGLIGRENLAGSRCLDVGCGAGRWCRWLASQGAASVVGVDPTAAILEVAKSVSPGMDFLPMSATQLGFAAESFDVVTCVTVIQHLRPEEQDLAAAELCRVLRPGGLLFVLDLIDTGDPGRIVFPRPASAWVDLYRRSGLRLERWSGQEYVPLFRALTTLLAAIKPAPRKGEAVTETLLEHVGRVPYVFLPLWPVMMLSYPLELACEKLLPATWARHGSFLFRKSAR